MIKTVFWFAFILIAKIFASESLHLTNIIQLTSKEIGFKRAGEAYFSPDRSKIVFQAIAHGEEDYQIYLMDLKEKLPKRISPGEGPCTCAFFHPTKEKVIFASSHSGKRKFSKKEDKKSNRYVWDLVPYMNIYESNYDGTELVALTEGPSYHAECGYSHDGKEIVFASNLDGSMNIYTMNADGSNITQMTYTSHCYNGGPFFSPDGKKIIFRADPDKKDFLQIYLLDRDTKKQQALTSDESVNWAPFWHPNGDVIAYTKSLNHHQKYEIYLMNIHTKAEKRLTYESNFNGLPCFSQDGKKFLWTSKREEETPQIFIADFVMPAELITPELRKK